MARVITLYYCTTLTGCCGVREFSDMSVSEELSEEKALKRQNAFDSRRCFILSEGDDPLEKLIAHLRTRQNNDEAAFYQAWFVKELVDTDERDGDYEDEFDAEFLRNLVQQIPGVVKLGEAVNPNSGNIIDGYFWKAL